MTIITTGVVGGDLGTRQELRNFIKNRELTDLYLLALQRFQATDQKNMESWFQVAGIHGRPYLPYDGVKATGVETSGYCTHSSMLFPGWHRAYLALFEQILTGHVKAIAKEYPANVQDKYVKAAAQFRIPYWDWASEYQLPHVVTEPELKINTPKGNDKPIKNPLYAYTFHPFTQWNTTVRWPTSSGASDNKGMNDYLSKSREEPRGKAFNLISKTTSDYQSFASSKSNPDIHDNNHFDSLESIHDGIHGATGYGGHMNQPEYAAFDPIFWLHHCNVDRLYTLWQTRFPKTPMPKGTHSKSDFTTRSLSPESDTTPLQPFRHKDGGFWTVKTADDTRAFNYTYPELVGWSTLDDKAKAARVIQYVNTVYGEKSPFAKLSDGIFDAQPQPLGKPPTAARRVAEVAAPSSLAASVAPAPAPAPAQSALTLTNDKKSYIDWVVNISVEKYIARGSFSIFIFLGDFDTDHTKWIHDPNLVGTHFVLASDISSTGCEQCQEAAEENLRVTGSVPLTNALGRCLGQDRLGNLDPEQIAPYLRKELHWRVQNSFGEVIQLQDIPQLEDLRLPCGGDASR